MEVRTSCIAFICKSLFFEESIKNYYKTLKSYYKIACQVLILYRLIKPFTILCET